MKEQRERGVAWRWVVLGALVAAGCGGEGATTGGSSNAIVDTLADGRISVMNTGPRWTEGTRWTVEQDLRLGTLDGEGPDQFGQIAALEVDAEGRMYVLDYLSQDIRVFNPDGSHSHNIGRPGQGPGELMRAAGLNFHPDGSLWVWDPGGRFSIFSLDGDFIDSHPRLVRGVVYPWRGEFDLDGSLIDWGLEYPGLDGSSGNSPTRIIYYPTRFSGDFSSGDTLPVLEYDFEMTADGERKVFGEILSSFQDRQGAIWFAHNKTFTVLRRTLVGDTTLQFSIDATPAPVTGHEVDSVRAIYIEQGRADRAPDVDQFAAEKQMIRRIFGDGGEHIYVVSEMEGLPLGTFIDVFEVSGVYLGRIDLPAPINFPYPPPTATDTHLYYVTTDEFDVEYVVRLRIHKPAIAVQRP